MLVNSCVTFSRAAAVLIGAVVLMLCVSVIRHRMSVYAFDLTLLSWTCNEVVLALPVIPLEIVGRLLSSYVYGSAPRS